MLNALRWIAILPCAVLAFYIGLGLHLLIMQLNDDGGLLMKLVIKYVAPIFAGGVGGLAFVLVSIYLAPTYKTQTGIIMMIILAMCMGIGFYLGVLQEHGIWILQSIATVIGGILGLLQGLAIVDNEPVSKKRN